MSAPLCTGCVHPPHIFACWGDNGECACREHASLRYPWDVQKVDRSSLLPTLTQKLRGKPVTHDQALTSAQRLINSFFGNPDQAHVGIPASYRDDDITIIDYILEQRATQG